MRIPRLNALTVTVLIIVAMVATLGWGYNLATVIGHGDLTDHFTLRVIGIPIVPLGAVMGYL